jgi:hypothetical protein
MPWTAVETTGVGSSLGGINGSGGGHGFPNSSGERGRAGQCALVEAPVGARGEVQEVRRLGAQARRELGERAAMVGGGATVQARGGGRP